MITNIQKWFSEHKNDAVGLIVVGYIALIGVALFLFLNALVLAALLWALRLALRQF